MTLGIIDTSILTSIANAIRTKLGVQTTYKPSEMASAIGQISSGITPTGTKQISITSNGTTTEDVTAYANAEVVVNVPTGVTPTGTKQISVTQNGTVTEDVTNYASVEINANVVNADYTAALTALGVQNDLANSITALTTYANGVTGESDTNLSDAVHTLGSGYGQGGPLTLIGTKTIEGLSDYTDTSNAETHDTGIDIKNTDYAFGLIVITSDAAITTSAEWGMTVAPFGRYTSNGNIFVGGALAQLQQKGSATLSKAQMVNNTMSVSYGVTVVSNADTVQFSRKAHGTGMPKIRGGTYTVKVYALTSF